MSLLSPFFLALITILCHFDVATMRLLARLQPYTCVSVYPSLCKQDLLIAFLSGMEVGATPHQLRTRTGRLVALRKGVRQKQKQKTQYYKKNFKKL